MKWMIASDLHGSAYWCEKLLERYREEKAGKLLMLGDILYHGPRNDLPKDYAPKKVIEMLNGMKEELLCIRGNCDCEVDQMVLQFPILADYAAFWLDERMVWATHGHVFNTSNCPKMKKETSSCTATPISRRLRSLGTAIITSIRALSRFQRKTARTAI